MKICHVGIAPADVLPGGLNTFVDALVGTQRGMGDRVELVTLGPPGYPGRRVAADLGASLASRLRGLRREIGSAAAGMDLLDVHFAWHYLPSLGLERTLPLVVHFHGPWGAESSATGSSEPVAWAKRRVESLVFSRTDAFIVLSEHFRDALENSYGVDNKRIHVVRPGVDHDRFCPGDKRDARLRLGLPLDGPLVLAVRRLVPRMGLLDLIQAMTLVDARLVIVGEGPSRGELEEAAGKAGLGSKVFFMGRLSDNQLADAYRAADVSVLPTRALEGFGLVVLESLSCGTPVVARAVGGLTEAMRGFESRALVYGTSVGALSNAIRSMICDPVSPETCRRVALESSWLRTSEETAAVYSSVLMRRSA